MNITAQSLELLLKLADDLTVGEDQVRLTPQTRGNFTQLKKAGLVASESSEHLGETYFWFTTAGMELAREHGIQVPDWQE